FLWTTLECQAVTVEDLGGLHQWARCDLVCLVYVMSTVWNFFINSVMFPLLILRTGCKTQTLCILSSTKTLMDGRMNPPTLMWIACRNPILRRSEERRVGKECRSLGG